MRIAIVTDAWEPQVNGVVRTLKATIAELEARGHVVEVIAPDRFGSLPCPTYPEIRLALAGRYQVGELIRRFAPDALHIATEGPLGVSARNWAVERGYAFTTAYHTRFPEYVAARTGLPAGLLWRFMRWFHAAAEATLVATPSLAAELAERGIEWTQLWGRGVDLSAFGPDGPRHPEIANSSGPVMLYVGRVAVEKSIEDFLSLGRKGTKVIVGDGPQRAALERAYPQARFLGALRGEALANAYRAADVFVFPSRTDTFGLVMIEALACGTPVAAYPVAGPHDVIDEGVGALDHNLGAAIDRALTRNRAWCAGYATRFTWAVATDAFEAALAPLARRTPLRREPHRYAA